MKKKELMEYIDEYIACGELRTRLVGAGGGTISVAGAGTVAGTGSISLAGGVVTIASGAGGSGNGGNDRGNRRQRETEDLLEDVFGEDNVERLPEVNGGNGHGVRPTSNPDVRVNGRVFDIYPPEGNNIRSIMNTINNKSRTQSSNIILNLDDFIGSVDELTHRIIGNVDSSLHRVNEIWFVRDGVISVIFQR